MRTGGGGNGGIVPPKGAKLRVGEMWAKDENGQVYAVPIPGSVAPSTTKAPTHDQANANLFASRMESSNQIFDDVGTNYSPLKMNILEAVPADAGNYLMDTNEQRVSQAQRDFINATLRRESGAVISDQEFANARKQYLPQPGDKPDAFWSRYGVMAMNTTKRVLCSVTSLGLLVDRSHSLKSRSETTARSWQPLTGSTVQ